MTTISRSLDVFCADTPTTSATNANESSRSFFMNHRTRAVLADIQSRGTQRDRVGDMLTRKELYELLDYDGYDARDRYYFG